jgi:hypothetical protein
MNGALQPAPEIKVFESRGGTVRHYVLPLRSKAILQAGITVRVGPSDVLLCLSCLKTDCHHVDRIRDFHREYERKSAAAEAGV